MGKVMRNAYYNWLGFVINLLITLFVTPFIIRSLGTDIYGIWALTLSVTGYFGLLNFGLYNSVIKYVSEYNAKDDYERISEVSSVCFTIFALIGLVVFILSIPLALNFTRIFKSASGYASAATVIFIVMFQLALEFPFRVFRSILSGMQRYDITNIAFIFVAVLRAALIVLFLKLGYSLLSLVLIGFFTNIIPYQFIYFYVKKKYPKIRIRFCRPSAKTAKMLFSYSSLVFIIVICVIFINNSSAVLAAVLISVEAVTFFTVASRFVSYLYSLVQSVAEVLTPAISELDAKNNTEEIRRIFCYSTEILLLATLPMGVLSLFLGKPFFILWLGDKFLVSYHILLILIMPQAFSLSLYGAAAIMFGMARLKFLAKIKIVETVMVLGLTVILVRKFGLYGLALGVSIPVLFFEGIVMAVYSLVLLKIPFSIFVRKSLFLPVCSSGALFVFLALLSRYFYPDNWYSFSAEAAACMLFYLLCVSALSPNGHKIRQVLGKLQLNNLRVKEEVKVGD